MYRLDVGGNACALGGAYKAVWAVEGEDGEGFEEFIGARWKEDGFVTKVDEGYREETFGRYGGVLKAFEGMEKEVLKGEGK